MAACGFHPIYGVNKYTPVGAETKFENIYNPLLFVGFLYKIQMIKKQIYKTW